MHIYCKNYKKHTGNTFPKKKISRYCEKYNQRKIKMCCLFD